ncbi:high-affinity choline transporter 1 [Trichonephila clavipes]|nr:high-affinity choline transporter 1 [Trichonephila clavipes]
MCFGGSACCRVLRVSQTEQNHYWGSIPSSVDEIDLGPQGYYSAWLCIPFSLTNDAVGSLSLKDTDWIGSVEPAYVGQYMDYGLLLILGGIPWQVYFQRVLSSKTAFRAQLLSYVAAFGCIIMAIPPMIIGAVAKATGFQNKLTTALIFQDMQQKKDFRKSGLKAAFTKLSPLHVLPTTYSTTILIYSKRYFPVKVEHVISSIGHN